MRFWRSFETVTLSYELIGVVGILLMLLFTMIDVVGAKLFLNPLRGTIELVGFAQVIAIAGALASGLSKGRHIIIDFFVPRMPRTVQIICNIFASGFGFLLFALLSRESFKHGLSLYRAGEIASTARMPLYPFPFLITFAAILASIFFLKKLVASFLKEVDE